MKKTWISADLVFDGKDLHENHAVSLDGGKVTALAPMASIGGQAESHVTGILAPGFLDIQVNGGGGVMLNSTPTAEGIATIASAHRRFGTVALMPTVITDAPDVLCRAVEAVLNAHDVPGVVGLHIEGPHISRAKRGTHASEFLRPMEAATIAHVERLRTAGLAVIITVAPEVVSLEDIAVLAEMGAIVSLGHSDADAETVHRALDAGARCFTHLHNAMSQMLGRAPGMTGAAICSDAWCSIIADGIHVDPQMIALSARARPVRDRMIAVSDAMATVGGPDHFELYGRQIRLRGGKLVNSEGALAGAHLAMITALQNLVSYGFRKEEALRMCRHNALELLGLLDSQGFIGTRTEDLVSLSHELELEKVGLT